MGYTIQRFAIGSDSPTQIAGSSKLPRLVEVTNVGFVPVWFGTGDVVIGRGRVLWPYDPPYQYTELDELNAVANNGIVIVDERGEAFR